MAEIVKKSTIEQPRSGRSGVIESEVFDASRKARTIVLDAQSKAEEILKNAEREAAVIRQRAHQEGSESGRQEGLAQYEEAILAVNAEHDEFMGQAEAEVTQLAVGIARKLIDTELVQNPTAIVGIVRKAMAPMTRKKAITLRVHPEDRAALEKYRPELLEALLSGGTIHFSPDPAISRGGCVIETDHGSVDARLETQLQAFNRILTGHDEVIELPETTIETSGNPRVPEGKPVFTAEPPETPAYDEETLEAEVAIEPETDPEADPEPNPEPNDDELWEAVSEHPVASLKTAAENRAVDETPAPEDSTQLFMKDFDQLKNDLEGGADVNDLLKSIDEYLQDVEKDGEV